MSMIFAVSGDGSVSPWMVKRVVGGCRLDAAAFSGLHVAMQRAVATAAGTIARRCQGRRVCPHRAHLPVVPAGSR